MSQIQQVTLATELSAITTQKAALEEREAFLRSELLQSLKSQGVRTVKLEDGTLFARTDRSTLRVKPGEEESAFRWAKKNNALKIDTGTAAKILRRELKTPKFFNVIRTEYLTIKRKGTDATDTE